MIYSPLELLASWRVRCYLNGTRYDVVGMPKVDWDLNSWFQAQPSTCDIYLKDIPPDTSEYTTARVEISRDGGFTWHPLFRGVAQPKSLGILGMERVVTATDILSYLDTDASATITWSGATYLQCIEDLLIDAGIPASYIVLPTSTSDLVTRNSITHTVTTSDNIKDVMEKLLKFGRYVLYVDPSGTVRMRKYSTIPERAAETRFSTDDVQATEYGIISAKFSREIGNNDGIVRRVEVSVGDTSSDIYGYWETTSPKAAKGKTLSDSNDFCKTAAQCVEMATDWGQDECRNNNTVVFSVPADTDLQPGLCIEVKSAANGFVDFTPARIVKVSLEQGKSLLTVSTNARAIGSGDDGGEGLEPDGFDETSNPTADFTYTVEREGNIYALVLESTSKSDGSSIASFAWSVTGAGAGYPSPALGTNAKETTVVDTLENISVTLEVTDANGGTATVTKDIAADETDIYTRQLSAVVDDKWEVLLDYDVGWTKLSTGTSVPYCVPQYSDTPYLFCLCTDGTVYRYNTEAPGENPIRIAYFEDNGGRLCIAQGEAFASEESANTLIVGTGSRIFVSYNCLDDDPLFTRSDVKGDVWQVAVDPYNPKILYAAISDLTQAPYAVFVSYDGGASWVVGEESVDVTIDFARFPWSPGIAILNDTNILPEQTSATTPTFSNATTITPGLEEEKLVWGTNEGYIFKQTADSRTQIHDGSILSDVRKLVRDGEFNDIIWGADNSTQGVFKIVGEQSIFSLKPATTGATSVGYGLLSSVKVPPEPPLGDYKVVNGFWTNGTQFTAARFVEFYVSTAYTSSQYIFAKRYTYAEANTSSTPLYGFIGYGTSINGGRIRVLNYTADAVPQLIFWVGTGLSTIPIPTDGSWWTVTSQYNIVNFFIGALRSYGDLRPIDTFDIELDIPLA